MRLILDQRWGVGIPRWTRSLYQCSPPRGSKWGEPRPLVMSPPKVEYRLAEPQAKGRKGQRSLSLAEWPSISHLTLPCPLLLYDWSHNLLVIKHAVAQWKVMEKGWTCRVYLKSSYRVAFILIKKHLEIENPVWPKASSLESNWGMSSGGAVPWLSQWGVGERRSAEALEPFRRSSR